MAGKPQAPGRAPRSAALRASGTTHEGPQRWPWRRGPASRTTIRATPAPPGALLSGAPPARRPARGRQISAAEGQDGAMTVRTITRAADLDAELIREVAAGQTVRIAGGLLARVQRQCEHARSVLRDGGPVYGVN